MANEVDMTPIRTFHLAHAAPIPLGHRVRILSTKPDDPYALVSDLVTGIQYGHVSTYQQISGVPAFPGSPIQISAAPREDIYWHEEALGIVRSCVVCSVTGGTTWRVETRLGVEIAE